MKPRLICGQILIVLVTQVLYSSANAPSLYSCVDWDCEDWISKGKTLLTYSAKTEKHLSFKKNVDIFIISKPVNKAQTDWVGKIGNKVGLVPKEYVREDKMNKSPKFKLELHDIPAFSSGVEAIEENVIENDPEEEDGEEEDGEEEEEDIQIEDIDDSPLSSDTPAPASISINEVRPASNKEEQSSPSVQPSEIFSGTNLQTPVPSPSSPEVMKESELPVPPQLPHEQSLPIDSDMDVLLTQETVAKLDILSDPALDIINLQPSTDTVLQGTTTVDYLPETPKTVEQKPTDEITPRIPETVVLDTIASIQKTNTLGNDVSTLVDGLSVSRVEKSVVSEEETQFSMQVEKKTPESVESTVSTTFQPEAVAEGQDSTVSPRKVESVEPEKLPEAMKLEATTPQPEVAEELPEALPTSESKSEKEEPKILAGETETNPTTETEASKSENVDPNPSNTAPETESEQVQSQEEDVVEAVTEDVNAVNEPLDEQKLETGGVSFEDIQEDAAEEVDLKAKATEGTAEESPKPQSEESEPIAEAVTERIPEMESAQLDQLPLENEAVADQLTDKKPEESSTSHVPTLESSPSEPEQIEILKEVTQNLEVEDNNDETNPPQQLDSQENAETSQQNQEQQYQDEPEPPPSVESIFQSVESQFQPPTTNTNPPSPPIPFPPVAEPEQEPPKALEHRQEEIVPEVASSAKENPTTDPQEQSPEEIQVTPAPPPLLQDVPPPVEVVQDQNTPNEVPPPPNPVLEKVEAQVEQEPQPQVYREDPPPPPHNHNEHDHSHNHDHSHSHNDDDHHHHHHHHHHGHGHRHFRDIINDTEASSIILVIKHLSSTLLSFLPEALQDTILDVDDALVFTGIIALTLVSICVPYFLIEGYMSVRPLKKKVNELNKSLWKVSAAYETQQEEFEIFKQKAIAHDEFKKRADQSENDVVILKKLETKHREQITALKTQLKSQMKEAVDIRALIEKTLEDKKVVVDECEKYKSAYETTKEALVAAKEELNRVQNQAKSSALLLNTSGRNVEVLTAKISMLEEQTEEIKSQLGAEVQKRKGVEVEKQEVEKKKAAVEKELTEFKNICHQYEGSVSSLNDEISKLESELITIKETLGDDSPLLEIAEVQAKAAFLQKDSDSLRTRLDGLTADNEILSGKLKETSRILEEARGEKEQTFNKLQVLEKYFKEREEEYIKTIEQLQLKESVRDKGKEELIRIIEEKENVCKDLDERLEALKEEFEETKQQHRNEIRALEAKGHENWLSLCQAERKAQDARKEAKLLRQRLTALSKEKDDEDGDGLNGEVPMFPVLPDELVPLPILDDPPSYFGLGDFVPPPPLPEGGEREPHRPPPLGGLGGRLSPSFSDLDDNILSPIGVGRREDDCTDGSSGSDSPRRSPALRGSWVNVPHQHQHPHELREGQGRESMRRLSRATSSPIQPGANL